MGGCMSYQRMLHRNYLLGDYGITEHGNIAGDLRRMERDQRDERHVTRYATMVGITEVQVRRLMELLFDADCEGQTYHD